MSRSNARRRAPPGNGAQGRGRRGRAPELHERHDGPHDIARNRRILGEDSECECAAAHLYQCATARCAALGALWPAAARLAAEQLYAHGRHPTGPAWAGAGPARGSYLPPCTLGVVRGPAPPDSFCGGTSRRCCRSLCRSFSCCFCLGCSRAPRTMTRPTLSTRPSMPSLASRHAPYAHGARPPDARRAPHPPPAGARPQHTADERAGRNTIGPTHAHCRHARRSRAVARTTRRVSPSCSRPAAMPRPWPS